MEKHLRDVEPFSITVGSIVPYATGLILDHFHDIHRRVRRVRPSHAPLRVDAVELVDVAAGSAEKTIT